jgi:hypothetical protein
VWAHIWCFHVTVSAYTIRLWRQIAAATKKRDAVALKRVFLRIRNAHGGVDAAATAKAQSRAPYWIMLLYATPCGGRLPPLRRNAMLLP